MSFMTFLRFLFLHAYNMQVLQREQTGSLGRPHRRAADKPGPTDAALSRISDIDPCQALSQKCYGWPQMIVPCTGGSAKEPGPEGLRPS